MIFQEQSTQRHLLLPNTCLVFSPPPSALTLLDFQIPGPGSPPPCPQPLSSISCCIKMIICSQQLGKQACDACQQGVGGHPSAGRMERQVCEYPWKVPSKRSRDESSRRLSSCWRHWWAAECWRLAMTGLHTSLHVSKPAPWCLTGGLPSYRQQRWVAWHQGAGGPITTSPAQAFRAAWGGSSRRTSRGPQDLGCASGPSCTCGPDSHLEAQPPSSSLSFIHSFIKGCVRTCCVQQQ